MKRHEPDAYDRAKAEEHLRVLRRGGLIVYRHGKSFLLLPEGGERQVSRLALRVLMPQLDQGSDGAFRLTEVVARRSTSEPSPNGEGQGGGGPRAALIEKTYLGF